MKKIFASLFLIIVLISNSYSQSAPLSEGDKQLNLGVGLSDYGIPVYLGMDFMVHPEVSVGGEIGIRKHTYRRNGERYSDTRLHFLTNGNYHFNKLLNIPTEWDVYAGVNLGMVYWMYDHEWDGDNNEDLGLDIGLQFGGRYYFKKNMAGQLEFGWGSATYGAKLGITFVL